MTERKIVKRKRITAAMVDRALDIYLEAMDFGHLSGPWPEHQRAMRNVLRDVLMERRR